MSDISPIFVDSLALQLLLLNTDEVDAVDIILSASSSMRLDLTLLLQRSEA